jgi:DNA-binding winged helix-turn-helix (wHTH) protein
MSRYRFGEFTLSPRQRLLLNGDREIRLIPRYLDLLIFLVEHRHEAVHRRDIFERVWTDVIVSDSALAQAIRTLRRTLGDDSREPVFIRTISRHGYQFVFREVVEESDDIRPATVAMVNDAPSDRAVARNHANAAQIDPDAARPFRLRQDNGETGSLREDDFEPLLERLLRDPSDARDDEDQREAAERLHQLGTAEALKRLGTRAGHTRARAVLRDTRWDVAEAGAVPLFGQPGAFETATALIRLRIRRVARLAAHRSVAAAIGGAAAGALAGAIGGLLLSLAPGSSAPVNIAAVLALIGAACGAWGGAAVGFGISIAEAAARSRKALAVVSSAALSGGVAGFAAQWIARAALATLVGVQVDVGGAVEGLVIGAGAGVGLAPATVRAGFGLAAPRGRLRVMTVLLTAASCAIAALLLALAGSVLVGGTIHAIAQAAGGSEAVLTPLSRVLGEPDFGPLTRALVGMGEGAMFGLGTAVGLTRRPE